MSSDIINVNALVKLLILFGVAEAIGLFIGLGAGLMGSFVAICLTIPSFLISLIMIVGTVYLSFRYNEKNVQIANILATSTVYGLVVAFITGVVSAVQIVFGAASTVMASAEIGYGIDSGLGLIVMSLISAIGSGIFYGILYDVGVVIKKFI